MARRDRRDRRGRGHVSVSGRTAQGAPSSDSLLGPCWLSHLLNRFGCKTLAVDVATGPIYEAQRYRAARAVMLVHSFSLTDASFCAGAAASFVILGIVLR